METKAFWDKRNEHMEAELQFARNHPVDRKTWLINQLVLTERTPMNAEKIAQMQAELKQIEDAQSDAFWGEWSKDVTVSRRQEWNNRVRAGDFNAKPGKPTVVQMKNAERAQGWTMENLKKAIAKWGL